jgi:hypothetical protein
MMDRLEQIELSRRARPIIRTASYRLLTSLTGAPVKYRPGGITK